MFKCLFSHNWIVLQVEEYGNANVVNFSSRIYLACSECGAIKTQNEDGHWKHILKVGDTLPFL